MHYVILDRRDGLVFTQTHSRLVAWLLTRKSKYLIKVPARLFFAGAGGIA